MNSGYTISSENISVNYFCGEAKGDLLGDHCHDKFEITLAISADGRYIVEGSEHKVSRGTLFLISPMSYHKVIINTESTTELYSIHFNPSDLPEGIASILERLTDSGRERGRIFPSRCIPDELLASFDRFSIAERLSEAEKNMYIQALISEIIILLSAAEGEEMVRLDNDLGARVCKYLNSNIQRNICLDKLARRFFVSKYYLCRAFKSYSGTSVHAYVNHKRIILAKQLIESGMTASHAAEKVGFGDYSAFYRSYVKIIGKSPTA